jgi:uncharacterized protein
MSDAPLFLAAVAGVAFVAGGVASVSGFGIGSLLTPVFASQIGARLAVAAVSIPHVVATALRFWTLREHVDRRLLRSFGVTSALGGLAGALLHGILGNAALQAVFGGLLVFAGGTGLAGLAERFRLKGWAAWTAGAFSGFLGGLVGNQGGIRSAAMLGFDIPRHAFVGTATAVALAIDAARLPVYLFLQGRDLIPLWLPTVAATAGAIIGTLAGKRLLHCIPEPIYRRVISAIILSLGVAMLAGVRY